MPQYLWTSASVGVVPPTTGGAEEIEIGDKEEEDHLLEEMYPHWDMEAHPHVSIVERKDTMHTTVLKRNSNPIMRGITNKPTSSTWRKKIRTMK